MQSTDIKVWAVQRTQTYPKVFEFKPYDLAICALLDSYYPRKINYYVLDLNDHKKNLQLANKVLKELGIQVLIENVDDKEISEEKVLKQLELIQKVIEPNHVSKNNKANDDEKILNKLPNRKATESKLREQIKKDKLAYANHQFKGKNEISAEYVEKIFNENRVAYEKRREALKNQA